MQGNRRGKLIVFEGVEGGGKSTQLQHLHQWLQASERVGHLQRQGHIREVVCTREPGGTALGTHLRRLLLDQPGAMASESELLLYAADRAQHVAEVIRPGLDRGDWVLCDRYIASTVAYQGYGRQLDLALIHQLNDIATQGLQPDLTFWLQLPVDVGLARTRQRGPADRMEQADLAFHQRVQAGFEAQFADLISAPSFDPAIAPISASAPTSEVAQAIAAVVSQYIAVWYRPHLQMSPPTLPSPTSSASPPPAPC